MQDVTGLFLTVFTASCKYAAEVPVAVLVVKLFFAEEQSAADILFPAQFGCVPHQLFYCLFGGFFVGKVGFRKLCSQFLCGSHYLFAQGIVIFFAFGKFLFFFFQLFKSDKFLIVFYFIFGLPCLRLPLTFGNVFQAVAEVLVIGSEREGLFADEFSFFVVNILFCDGESVTSSVKKSESRILVYFFYCAVFAAPFAVV